MKRLLILSTLLIFCTAAFAQKSNAFKVNLLSPLVKTGNFQFERVIGEKGSAQLGFFFTDVSPSGSTTKFSGIGITPEYRIYPSGTAMDGFYVAPFFRYRSFKLSDSDTSDEGELSIAGGGLIAGREWIFGEMITFELFIGPMYSSSNFKVTSGAGDSLEGDFFDGFGVRAGLSLGIAF